jgi:phosphoglycerol transferase MdoB-like AlkP superfamily enzyme
MFKSTAPNSQREHHAINQLIADLIVWTMLVFLLAAFRGFLLFIFRAQLAPDSHASAIFRCFRTGIHYDIQVATYVMLPSLLLSAVGFFIPTGAWPARVRLATLIVGFTACALAFVGDVGYFAEYQNQFDHWIFGLIYDDQRAIFETIWKSYPIVWLSLGIALAVATGVWSVNKLCRFASAHLPVIPRLESGMFRMLILILATTLVVFGSRGSLGRRPMQLKDAATTGDLFLNKLVLNPFIALKDAIDEHRQLQSAAGLESFLPHGDITGAARALFPQRTNALTLDDYLIHTARGAATKPQHIFLVVMESYDSWPMQPPFAAWGLTENLTRLGKAGIRATAFLSAAGGTMPSLTAIITGLPFTDVNANYRESIRQGLPTDIAVIFKKLGYCTRFFYSGYLSWQRLGPFAKEQGFDDVFGGDQMSAELTGNEWGVDDDVLFNFILAHTDDQPTFDMVMTTSYHPPFSVDLTAKGFSEDAMLKTESGQRLSAAQRRIYGHLWFADKSVGAFADVCEQRFERPLIAITGDHFSRRYPPDLRPTLFERKAVPFVLSGREVLAHVKRPAALAGSHNDIAPTLVGLAAPRGFVYHSAGRDLLDPALPQIGYGIGAVVGTNFILEISDATHPEDLSGRPFPAGLALNTLKLDYNELHALAWWDVMRGNTLPTNAPRLPYVMPSWSR